MPCPGARDSNLAQAPPCHLGIPWYGLPHCTSTHAPQVRHSRELCSSPGVQGAGSAWAHPARSPDTLPIVGLTSRKGQALSPLVSGLPLLEP